MANNLVVTLLLKSGAFSQDLKTARGQIQNFQKGCDTAGKSVSAFGKAIGIDVGALTKFGGAVGAAMIAGKAFKAVIDSNQKSADTFAGVMYAAKTSVNEFAYAIGTFDFSNFQNGLSDLISRARNAAMAIDQLGDTLRSYDLASAKARASLAHARKVINDKTSTKEEKEAAIAKAQQDWEDLRETTVMAIDDYANAIIAEANAKGAKLSGEGALKIVEDVLLLNGKKGREKMKEEMKALGEEYAKEVAAIESNYNQGSSMMYSGNYGAGFVTSTNYKTNPQYQAEMEALNKKYERYHAYNTLLNKYSDEQIDNTTKQMAAMYGLEESLDSLGNKIEIVENKGTSATAKTTKGIKEESQALEGSLADWQKQLQIARQARDMEVYDSANWHKFQRDIDIATEKIEKLTALERQRRWEGRLQAVGVPENAPTGKAESNKTPGLNGQMEDVKMTENEMLSRVKWLEEERKKYKEGAKEIAQYNQEIAALNKRIDALHDAGLTIPVPPKEAVNTWDKFNSALSDTAMIVSSVSSAFQEGSEMTASSILQMVATCLPAIGSLISALDALTVTEAVEAGTAAVGKAVSTSQHWVEAIAAVASLSAVVAAAIAAASRPKTQKFATGGIVGGNSFYGDRVSAQVNSGEMILNRSQQARLFQMANSGGMGGQVEFHISGTELVGVLNNQNRKNNLIR